MNRTLDLTKGNIWKKLLFLFPDYARNVVSAAL